MTPDDACFYLGEYTARQGYGYSPTNNLIYNFKKPMDRRGKPEWRYKEQAIRTAAVAFTGAIKSDWLETVTLVPVPPSKAKNDPAHDDRVLQMVQAIGGAKILDVRELILQSGSREAAHSTDCSRSPDSLECKYQINENLATPTPRIIVIVDDVLVTGASFIACKRLLHKRFPEAEIYGIFIARRVPEAIDLDSLFGDND